MIKRIHKNLVLKKLTQQALSANGPLAQSAERGAHIAIVVSSTLTWTFFFSVPSVQRSVGNVRITNSLEIVLLFLKLGAINIHDLNIKKKCSKKERRACVDVSGLLKWG